MGYFRGWKGLSEEVTSAWGSEGSEATSHVNIRRTCVPSKENRCSKVLMWEGAWHAQGRVKPTWPAGQRKQEGEW